jgi:ethanolamine utilization protein EutA (predicted chaperonin)
MTRSVPHAQEVKTHRQLVVKATMALAELFARASAQRLPAHRTLMTFVAFSACGLTQEALSFSGSVALTLREEAHAQPSPTGQLVNAQHEVLPCRRLS